MKIKYFIGVALLIYGCNSKANMNENPNLVELLNLLIENSNCFKKTEYRPISFYTADYKIKYACNNKAKIEEILFEEKIVEIIYFSNEEIWFVKNVDTRLISYKLSIIGFLDGKLENAEIYKKFENVRLKSLNKKWYSGDFKIKFID